MLRDGRRLVKAYDGRELKWGFDKDAEALRRLVPQLPIRADQYDRMIAAIAALDRAELVEYIARLTLA